MKRAMRHLCMLALLSPGAFGARRGLRQTHLDSKEQLGDAVHDDAGRSEWNTAGSDVGIAGKSQSKASLEATMGSLVMGMLTGNSGVTQSLEASMESMVMKFLAGKATLSHIIQVAHDKMDVSEAVERLEGKLPEEVQSLVRLAGAKNAVSGGKKASGELDEDSLQKARKILNSMIESAWKDLDAVVIECKEFEERNRETFSQVTTDLARLGSQIADLERKKVKATGGIAEQDRLRTAVEEELEQVSQEYQTTRLENEATMTVRKNDLAVFDFILALTRCKDDDAAPAEDTPEAAATPAPLFGLQLGAAPASRPQQQPRQGKLPDLSVCSTSSGLELRFGDARAQAKLEEMLTPTARLAIREALGMAQTQAPRGTALRLLQRREPNVSSTTPMIPMVTPEPDPVVEAPAEGQWKKCTDGKPNCGLLHDTMSLQWGKFRDLVDSLQAEMDKNHDAYKAEESNFNQQLSVIGDSKTQHQESLAETISNLNMDGEERTEKDEQHRTLEKAYDKKMKQCRAQVEEITFTNICAVRKVRNAVLETSKTSPPSKITDCDVKDWVAGECSVECDDSCPKPDPYACGGTQTLTREVIVGANEFGVKCPVLTEDKKCNQFKCPVDCQMSEWSGWSKCTKDCESGLQGESRSILTKPKNGGQFCDTVQEERTCNTESCDRDCSLVEWSDWSPCSMACSGGFRERVREVSVPIRGFGKCPEVHNPERYEEEECNTQECMGDEFCIAKQDLLILLDASGSVKEDGFEILRDFAANLTSKYETMYYGNLAMKVGAVLFGNGHRELDGTITAAINVMDLSDDMAAVHKAIMETKWQRGMTNMAQAFSLAKTMFQSGRADAQSAVLVLSDGKYSMQFATGEKVKELKDLGVKIFMAPVAEYGGAQELQQLQKWASFPYETNYERIPGLQALKFNPDSLAARLVAKFCSDSVSPSAQAQIDYMNGFMLIREGGEPNCGNRTNIGKVASLMACADEARMAEKLAFSYGHAQQDGTCIIAAMEITKDWFDKYLVSRREPPCPGGTWEPNPFFKTYAIEPFVDEYAE